MRRSFFTTFAYAIKSHPKNKEQVCWRSCRCRAVFYYNSCKNWESLESSRSKYTFPFKLADEKMSIKKEEVSSYLVYNIVSLRKMPGKRGHFSWKIAWKWTCSQIFRTCSYLENLLLFWIMSNKASAHLYALGSNIYTRKSSPVIIYLFKVSNRITRKMCSKSSINTPERLSSVNFLFYFLSTFNFRLSTPNFDHIS